MPNEESSSQIEDPKKKIVTRWYFYSEKQAASMSCRSKWDGAATTLPRVLLDGILKTYTESRRAVDGQQPKGFGGWDDYQYLGSTEEVSYAEA